MKLIQVFGEVANPSIPVDGATNFAAPSRSCDFFGRSQGQSNAKGYIILGRMPIDVEVKMFQRLVSDSFSSVHKFRLGGMSVLASGALKSREAFEYVCEQPQVERIIYGARMLANIIHSKTLCDELTAKAISK